MGGASRRCSMSRYISHSSSAHQAPSLAAVGSTPEGWLNSWTCTCSLTKIYNHKTAEKRPLPEAGSNSRGWALAGLQVPHPR